MDDLIFLGGPNDEDSLRRFRNIVIEMNRMGLPQSFLKLKPPLRQEGVVEGRQYGGFNVGSTPPTRAGKQETCISAKIAAETLVNRSHATRQAQLSLAGKLQFLGDTLHGMPHKIAACQRKVHQEMELKQWASAAVQVQRQGHKKTSTAMVIGMLFGCLQASFPILMAPRACSALSCG